MAPLGAKAEVRLKLPTCTTAAGSVCQCSSLAKNMPGSTQDGGMVLLVTAHLQSDRHDVLLQQYCWQLCTIRAGCCWLADAQLTPLHALLPGCGSLQQVCRQQHLPWLQLQLKAPVLCNKAVLKQQLCFLGEQGESYFILDTHGRHSTSKTF